MKSKPAGLEISSKTGLHFLVHMYIISSLRVLQHKHCNKVLVDAAQRAIRQLQSVLPPNGACLITSSVHGIDKRLTARVFDSAYNGGAYVGGIHLYLDGTAATFKKTQPHLTRAKKEFSKNYCGWHKRVLVEEWDKYEILCHSTQHHVPLVRPRG